jgi:hypothetical protein
MLQRTMDLVEISPYLRREAQRLGIVAGEAVSEPMAAPKMPAEPTTKPMSRPPLRPFALLRLLREQCRT